MKIDINNTYTHSLYILNDTIREYREKTGLPRHADKFLSEIEGQVREIENQIQEDFEWLIRRYSNRLYHMRMAVKMREYMEFEYKKDEDNKDGL